MNRRAVLLGLLTPALRSADWPQFRGVHGKGIAEGTAPLPVEFGPDKNLLWRRELPDGLSSPILHGARIFLTGLQGQKLVTLALQRSTGEVLWTRSVDRPRSEKLHQLNHAASPSAAVDSAHVIVFFPDFGLVAYSHDGAERWRVPLGPFQNIYGMGASPVIAGGKVILVCDQSKDSFIAAFDVKTGRQSWRTPRKEALSGHSTPVIEGQWVLAPGSFRMEAYDIQTGRVVWGVDGLPGEMKSVPVIDDGLLFVHGFNTPENDAGRLLDIPAFPKGPDGKLSKAEVPTPHAARLFPFLDLDSDGFLDASEWESYRKTMRAENALLAYKLGGGLVWKFGRSIPQLPSPLVYRGVLYMVNEGGVLTTLDAPTGKLHKQARLRGEADKYYASPVAGDGKIYIASHTGMVNVLKAGPEQELLAVNKLDEEILATPALVDGRIYLRTRRALWCFSAQPPAR